eukprot:g8196.t1
MFLRPRHVSAAALSSTTAVEDGQPAPVASIQEEIDGVLPPATAATKRRRRQRSILRHIRSQSETLNLNLHLSGVTRSRRKAMLAVCGGWCLLSTCTIVLFGLLRTVAMARVVSSASVVHDGGEMFTVLVNTFERLRQLEEAVRHYSTCEGVESVRVAWSEASTPPNAATNPHLFDHPRPVRIHAYPTTSINNRFIPPSHLLTEAVFVVDDDISVPCGHLRAAFQTWQQHPDTLVGFFPRSHAYEPSLPGEEGKEDAGGLWEYLYFWRVLLNMEYSIVLTKAAFVHAKYLELYSSGSGSDSHSDERDSTRVSDSYGGDTAGGHRRIAGSGDSDWSMAMVDAMVKTRAYVDVHRNCEDIAMQMAVTSVSGLPPVAAFAPVVDIGLFGGISTGEGSGRWWQAPHAVKRSRCLADLNEIFCAAHANDGQPLSPTASNGDGSRHGAQLGAIEPAPRQCKALIGTNLFASTATKPAAASADVAPHIRGGVRQTSFRGSGSGDSVGLSRLSRLELAVRAPTVAEFISADMVLVPAKLWKWFAKDDVFGRG